MSELELLQRAQNDDELAFKEIFHQNKYLVYIQIFDMVKDHDTAEDLMMETFEKAFKNIKKFVPNYKINSWICAIAKNHTLDYIRKQAIRPRKEELTVNISDNWNPEKIVIGNEQEKILEKIVSDLKGVYKEILLLCMDGKSYKEISETLNIPIGTLAPYLSFTRKKIIKQQNKYNRIKIKKEKESSKVKIKRKRVLTPEQKLKQKLYRAKHKEKYKLYHKKYRET